MNIEIDILHLLTALTVPMVVGWLVLNCALRLRRVFAPIEEWFVSFGLGTGLLTLAMFYCSIFNVVFVNLGMLAWCFVPVIILYFYRLKKDAKPVMAVADPQRGVAFWDTCIIALIIFNIVEVFIRTYFHSIDIWDSWAVWAFKAKIYFVHQRIPLERFVEFSQVWGNWDYPHHIPLLEAWVAMYLGYWNEQLTAMIFPVYFTGIVVCVYYFCKCYASRTISLIAAFGAASLLILQYVTVGAIAEPVILFYYCLSITLLLRWMNTGDKALFILSAIFSGLMSWTKCEGMAYSLFNGIILFIFLRKGAAAGSAQKMRPLLLYTLLVLAIIVPHLIFNLLFELKSIHVSNSTFSVPLLLSNVGVIPRSLYYIIMYFLFFSFFNILWPLFLTFWLKNAVFKAPRWSSSFILISILLHFLLIIFLSLTDTTILYLVDAMGRLLLAPALLAILYIFSCENKKSFFF